MRTKKKYDIFAVAVGLILVMLVLLAAAVNEYETEVRNDFNAVLGGQ